MVAVFLTATMQSNVTVHFFYSERFWNTVHKEMRYLDSLNPSERDINVVAHIQ